MPKIPTPKCRILRLQCHFVGSDTPEPVYERRRPITVLTPSLIQGRPLHSNVLWSGRPCHTVADLEWGRASSAAPWAMDRRRHGTPDK